MVVVSFQTTCSSFGIMHRDATGLECISSAIFYGFCASRVSLLNVNGFARVVANIQVAYRFFTCKMGKKW